MSRVEGDNGRFVPQLLRLPHVYVARPSGTAHARHYLLVTDPDGDRRERCRRKTAKVLWLGIEELGRLSAERARDRRGESGMIAKEQASTARWLDDIISFASLSDNSDRRHLRQRRQWGE